MIATWLLHDDCYMVAIVQLQSQISEMRAEYEVMKLLLTKGRGVDVDRADAQGATPLNMAEPRAMFLSNS